MYTDSLSITPLMVCLDGGKKAVIMEAGLENYPGMFLTVNPQTRQGVQAAFAPYPLEEIIGGHNRLNLIPTKRADYIARCANRSSPGVWCSSPKRTRSLPTMTWHSVLPPPAASKTFLD